MLILDKVNAGYGTAQVLFDLSLQLNAGECISLMGRNGMGKTTTVRAIMGELPLKSGQIQRFGDTDAAIESFEIARQGIGLVPEGRQFSQIYLLLKICVPFTGLRSGNRMNGHLRV